MDAVAESGRKERNSKHQIERGLKRVGTAEPVLRDQILRRERRQGETCFFCSIHHG